MPHVFAYGTLQLPKVLLAVTRRAFFSRPARLDHYARHRLRDRSFPGIRPSPGASVDGLLLLDVDSLAQQRLDRFEDAFYRLEEVTVATEDGATWPAVAYVVREESYDLLLPEDWNLEEFEQNDLPKFLRNHT
ncbi:MAG: gamma-glutamylcyclotransferase family protein [Candidatus Methylumidiphilus sp.]